MPVTPEAAEKYLTQLSAARPITHKKMFGGIGIYCDEVFFGVIDDDRLYLKTDGELDPLFDELNAERWILPDGKEQPYREVPVGDLANPSKLGFWIDESVKAAMRRKKAGRKKA